MNKKALENYFQVLDKKKKPKFKSIELDSKIKDAFRILEKCELCERKCGVNRIKGEVGICGIGNRMLISSMMDHYGEEYFFVPSFTIFFYGCTFSCEYCQNYDISQRIVSPLLVEEEQLVNIIEHHSYCKNINFVGGDPVPQLPFILKTLKFVKLNLPVVWNSNFFMSEKSMNLLRNVIDVYLSDFKYGNDKCALRLSKINNYWNIVTRNHLLAFKDSELVIRHLVLPNHVACCTKPVLDFISKNFKDKVVLNLMDQYRPEFHAYRYRDINRIITKKEFDEAVKYAKKLNLSFIT